MKLLTLIFLGCSFSIGGVAQARSGGGHHGGSHSNGHHQSGHRSGLSYGTHRGYYYAPSAGYGYRTYPRSSAHVSRYGGGATSLDVEVQRALARLGYYRGPIDGVIGSGTRRAIRNFQIAERLPLTSRIDRPTLGALGLG